jgi:elongation factor G
VQALLDAVIDYLPSPVDIPPIQGHQPQHDDTHIFRAASTRSRLPRWRSRS